MKKDGVTMYNYVNEKSKLDSIANDSIYAKGVIPQTIQYCGEIFLRHMKKGSVLELGPAEGVMTDIFFPLYSEDYTVVDGSEKFANDLKSRYPNINSICNLFEEYKPNRKFDNIVLGHVLEHVADPVKLLKLCKDWLKEDGRILTSVPNKNSIHRQAAVLMGLLKELDEFSPKDIRHGHRRVFGVDTLTSCFDEAKLNIIIAGGYWLKPISDKQLEDSWNYDMMDAFLKLGEIYPDIAAEIYIVAE